MPVLHLRAIYEAAIQEAIYYSQKPSDQEGG